MLIAVLYSFVVQKFNDKVRSTLIPFAQGEASQFNNSLPAIRFIRGLHDPASWMNYNLEPA